MSVRNAVEVLVGERARVNGELGALTVTALPICHREAWKERADLIRTGGPRELLRIGALVLIQGCPKRKALRGKGQRPDSSHGGHIEAHLLADVLALRRNRDNRER